MSGRKNNHRRSFSVMTSAGFFATLLLIATAASAGSDTTAPYNGTITNPCTTPADSVAFEGQEHIVSNNKVLNNGNIHTNFMDQITGKGPGSPSLLQYSVGLTSKINGTFPPGPVTFRSRTKVISDGPSPNFFETFFLHIKADGTPGATNFESDCRG